MEKPCPSSGDLFLPNFSRSSICEYSDKLHLSSRSAEGYLKPSSLHYFCIVLLIELQARIIASHNFPAGFCRFSAISGWEYAMLNCKYLIKHSFGITDMPSCRSCGKSYGKMEYISKNSPFALSSPSSWIELHLAEGNSDSTFLHSPSHVIFPILNTHRGSLSFPSSISSIFVSTL